MLIKTEYEEAAAAKLKATAQMDGCLIGRVYLSFIDKLNIPFRNNSISNYIWATQESYQEINNRYISETAKLCTIHIRKFMTACTRVPPALCREIKLQLLATTEDSVNVLLQETDNSLVKISRIS